MSNTYTQIHIHFVFAVKFRDAVIADVWKTDLYKYIAGIIKNNGHKLIAIGGMPDHIHLLIGVRPNQSISELLKFIKGDSSRWINKNNFVKRRFEWQAGFGAFSYSKSHLKEVIRYIENQEIHHKKRSFGEEYLEFLQKYGVDFDVRYIFKDLI